MRFLLLTLPALMAFNLHADENTAAIPLAVDAQATEFTTRTNVETGAIELQKADGTFELIAVKTDDVSSNQANVNGLPIVKVQYYGSGYSYGSYGYGYDCPPGYVPPPPPPHCYNCGAPVYYPRSYGPSISYGGAYYPPVRSYYGGGYQYNRWARPYGYGY